MHEPTQNTEDCPQSLYTFSLRLAEISGARRQAGGVGLSWVVTAGGVPLTISPVPQQTLQWPLLSLSHRPACHESLETGCRIHIPTEVWSIRRYPVNICLIEFNYLMNSRGCITGSESLIQSWFIAVVLTFIISIFAFYFSLNPDVLLSLFIILLHVFYCKWLSSPL